MANYIQSDCRLRPVLAAVEAALAVQERIILAIDGPCGSGKTTLAAKLCQLFDAPCLHMDDFYLPHAMKTPERLAQPGGNSHRERLLRETLQPWIHQGFASYRPYDCATDSLLPPVSIPLSRLLVLEGSYSHHPEVAALCHVKVFLTIDPQEQLRRIAHRSPEKLQQFIDRWIPLENSYFRAFDLPGSDAVILPQLHLQEM